MSMIDFLRQSHEPIPSWLANLGPETSFDVEEFFGSRTVFYPGAGADGQPVRTFAGAHAAHCFVYVDYDVNPSGWWKGVERSLSEAGFHGYRSIRRFALEQRVLAPGGWRPPVRTSSRGLPPKVGAGFAFVEILERASGLGDEHGSARIAILFLGVDGFAAYEPLYSGVRQRPFAVVVVDHGSGGNYDRFDAGGLLERAAAENDLFPEWLLVAHNSRAWKGYEKAPSPSVQGGVHKSDRALYRRGVGR